MKSKNFHLRFIDNSSPNSRYQTLIQYSNDAEIFEWLHKKAKEYHWDKITDIEVKEENKLLRIDLVLPILRPLLRIFKPGEILKPIFFQPLPQKDRAPKLTTEILYPLKNVVLDEKGWQHLDVGLTSKLNFVTSYETGDELPDGDKIHWCHPIRFIIVKGKTNDAMQFIKEDSQ